MADSEPIEPPDNCQILHADLKNHVRRCVSREIHDMIECADELRGLGATLDWHSALESRASANVIRETAVGVRAVAMQSFMTACRAAGISARLHSWADVIGITDLQDSEEEEPEAGEQEAPPT
jgi:hypothetical protein